MGSLSIIAAGAVGIPVVIRLLLELEKYLAANENRPKRLVAIKQ